MKYIFIKNKIILFKIHDLLTYNNNNKNCFYFMKYTQNICLALLFNEIGILAICFFSFFLIFYFLLQLS